MKRALKLALLGFLLVHLPSPAVLAEDDVGLDPEEDVMDVVPESETPPQPELTILGDVKTEKNDESKLNHTALMDDIWKRLDSPENRIRLEAGVALARNAEVSDLDELASRLKRGGNEEALLAIIAALGKFSDRKAQDALRFEIEQGNLVTQRAAVSALGQEKVTWPIPVLAKVLRKSPDKEMRMRAASALGRIGTNQAEYTLRTSLPLLDSLAGPKNATYWALEVLRGDVSDRQIDTEMPAGRRLQLYFKGTRYFFYHPETGGELSQKRTSDKPWLLVCIHDKDLMAEELFNICYRSARQANMAVLVPYVDPMRFPEYGNFNLRGQRFDTRLLELIEHVGKISQLSTRELYMFGFGEGGDFVQRFTAVYPQRIAKTVYESAEYTMPDKDTLFPLGLDQTPLAPDVKIDLEHFVKTEQLVVLRLDSPNYRRGKQFVENLEQFAKFRGIRDRVSAKAVDKQISIWGEAERYLFTDY